MYLHLGQSAVVPHREILGIFDLDNASWAYKTREFLERAEREGRAEVYAMRLGSARACLHVHGDDRVEGACEAAILGLRQLEGRYGAYLHMECAPD